MIPLMNLTRQYEALEQDLNEAVLKVLKSGKYITGDFYKESVVRKFEKEFAEYIGTTYAIAVANGTDALIIALKAAGVKAGDEVITCAMSFFSTAEAIANVGAKPVFVDCTKDTYVIDTSSIEEKITEKTKAIIPVHLYGYCANMDEVNRIAGKYNLMVIEDAAQAAGALYKGKKAGALGHAGCFSFFPTKNLGCAGDGGIITTDSEVIYKMARAYRVHGSGDDGKFAAMKEKNLNIECFSNIDFDKNLPKYFNFVIGYNSRLDEIQAAILRVKLPYLDEWNLKRESHAKRYSNLIKNPNLKLPICSQEQTHIYYVYVIETKNREKLRQYLTDYGVSTGVYFPVPLHLQAVFHDLGYQKGDMPHAEYLADHSLAIPMFAELQDEEVDKVIQLLNAYKA